MFKTVKRCGFEDAVRSDIEAEFYRVLDEQAPDTAVDCAVRDLMETSLFNEGIYSSDDVALAVRRVLFQALCKSDVKQENVELTEKTTANCMREKTNEVIISTYRIIVDVEVMEKSGHIVKKVTYPDVVLPPTAASVLRNAAKAEELYAPGSQADRRLTGYQESSAANEISTEEKEKVPFGYECPYCYEDDMDNISAPDHDGFCYCYKCRKYYDTEN